MPSVLRGFLLNRRTHGSLYPLNANDDLDAINDMLAAIGEPAVLQLDEGNADVSNAMRI
ncbi:tail fiber protein / tail tubular protein A [Enterobacter phage 01_vB_Eclo_IJM]|nr:tail fiber protein / tail tubular protein A [Enterobacter phage 01_vB_Eclo_IJM]